jgi:hypothetical protein
MGSLELFSGFYIFAGLMVLLGGIAMLVIGLVKKKKGLWISGTITLGMLILQFLIVLFIGLAAAGIFFNNYNDNYYTDQTYPEVQPAEPVKVEVSPSTDSLMRLQFDEPVYGKVEDQYQQAYDLSVYPNLMMRDLGISINDFQGKQSGDQKTSLLITFSFDKAYTGKFMLEAYGEGDLLLASASKKTDQSAGSLSTLEFLLPSTINPADLRYCTLTPFK